MRSPTAGVFARLAEPSLFAQVFVEHGAVTWPGEIDLAPDAMYAEIKYPDPRGEMQRAFINLGGQGYSNFSIPGHLVR